MWAKSWKWVDEAVLNESISGHLLLLTCVVTERICWVWLEDADRTEVHTVVVRAQPITRLSEQKVISGDSRERRAWASHSPALNPTAVDSTSRGVFQILTVSSSSLLLEGLEWLSSRPSCPALLCVVALQEYNSYNMLFFFFCIHFAFLYFTIPSVNSGNFSFLCSIENIMQKSMHSKN